MSKNRLRNTSKYITIIKVLSQWKMYTISFYWIIVENYCFNYMLLSISCQKDRLKPFPTNYKSLVFMRSFPSINIKV